MRKFEFVNRVVKSKEEETTCMKLPERSTANSMAYDFFAINDFEVKPKETKLILTGIKAYMEKDEGLMLNVRSSIGKKHIMLANSSGWVDYDYVNNSNNEGEIGLMFYNYGEEIWEVKAGEKIAQGMFIKYLTTDDDNAKGERNGGWGSTGK